MPENTISKEDLSEIVAVDDIPLLGSRVVKTAAGPIAIFKAHDHQIFAVYDECPHKKGPLSQGIVHGTTVTCPLHAWNINLADGNAYAPDNGCVKTFTTHIENGKVFLLRSEISSHA